MTQAQKDQLTAVWRRGFTDDAELDGIIREDIAAIEPIIDAWIAEARDWYFAWTVHAITCPGHSYPHTVGIGQAGFQCTCGLLHAIANRRKV